MQKHNLPILPTILITSLREKVRLKCLFFAVATLLCVMAYTATAADRYVHPSGSNANGNDCLDSNNPCKTIRHAVGEADLLAVPIDVIVLMTQGVPTQFQVNGLGINLGMNERLGFRGEGPDPAAIILAPTIPDRHFSISGVGSIRFENLTLTGGDSANDGGAISMTGGGRLELDRVVFEGNKAGTDGGGLALDGTLNAVDTEFRNNQALNGAGGGLHIEQGTAELEGVEMSDNSAKIAGGGISCRFNVNEGTGCTYLRVDKESRFMRNMAEQGGGIYTQANALIQETDFAGNETSSDSANQRGGAIFANIGIGNDSRLLIKKSEFVNNSTDGAGGAVAAEYSDVRIRRSTFWKNSAFSGAAVYFDEPSEQGALEMINSTFGENIADDSAGAIYIVEGQDHQLLSLTLVDNSISPASSCAGCAQDISIIDLGSNANPKMSRTLIDHPKLGVGGPECSNPAFSGENNLHQSDSCDSGNSPNFRVIGAAGALKFDDWGGRTRTYRITSGSAATDNGGTCTKFDGTVLQIDQRGAERKNPCDIGAFELP